ncbi:hypothetical protein FEDK69T_02160 [Flavobacterium enshiense DK69]|nr:hypothetical protein FEDK69T_02160 [Flavobacterium enshiense DK69]
MTEQLYQSYTNEYNKKEKDFLFIPNERSKTIAYELGFENKLLPL